MSKAKSGVWNYFLQTTTGGTCKMCNAEVKAQGTTNLGFHLTRKHPEISFKFSNDAKKEERSGKRKRVS